VLASRKFSIFAAATYDSMHHGTLHGRAVAVPG